MKSLNHGIITNQVELFNIDGSNALKLDSFKTDIPRDSIGNTNLKINLHSELTGGNESTFILKVKGSQFQSEGIEMGDILVVNPNTTSQLNDLTICVIDGEFSIRNLTRTSDGIFLSPKNARYNPVKISEQSDFQLWGVVTHIIKPTI